MLLLSKDEHGLVSAVADGYVNPRFQTRWYSGKLQTNFKISYHYDVRRDEFYKYKCCTYGEINAEFIRMAVKEKSRILMFATYEVDANAPKEAVGKDRYILVASTIIPANAMLELWTWHKSTMKYELDMMKKKTYSDRLAEGTDYDFDTGESVDPSF